MTAGDPEFFSAEKVSNLTFDFLKHTFLHAVAVEVSNEAVALDFLDDFRNREIAISHTLDALGHFCNVKIVAEFRSELRNNVLYVHSTKCLPFNHRNRAKEV